MTSFVVVVSSRFGFILRSNRITHKRTDATTTQSDAFCADYGQVVGRERDTEKKEIITLVNVHLIVKPGPSVLLNSFIPLPELMARVNGPS